MINPHSGSDKLEISMFNRQLAEGIFKPTSFMNAVTDNTDRLGRFMIYLSQNREEMNAYRQLIGRMVNYAATLQWESQPVIAAIDQLSTTFFSSELQKLELMNLAIQAGESKRIEQLCDLGIKPPIGDPLLFFRLSDQFKQPEIMRTFLNRFPQQISTIDPQGNTIIHYVAHCCDDPVLLQGLIGKEDLNVLYQQNNLNQSPLILAIEAKNLKVVDSLLVNWTVDPTTAGENVMSAVVKAGLKDYIPLVAKKGVDVNGENQEGVPFLIAAVENQQWGVMDALRKVGAKQDVTDNEGNHFLHNLAAYSDDTNLVDSVVKEAGNQVVSQLNTNDMTPLGVALDTKNEQMAIHLFFYWNPKNDAERADVLIDVIESELYIIIPIAINKGANPNAFSTDQKTPLMVAIELKDLDGVEVLVKNGAHVNQNIGQGKTPLTHAFLYGGTYLAKQLIEKGADASILDDKGLSPVYYGVVKHTADKPIHRNFKDAESFGRCVDGLAYLNTNQKEEMKNAYPQLSDKKSELLRTAIMSQGRDRLRQLLDIPVSQATRTQAANLYGRMQKAISSQKEKLKDYQSRLDAEKKNQGIEVSSSIKRNPKLYQKDWESAVERIQYIVDQNEPMGEKEFLHLHKLLHRQVKNDENWLSLPPGNYRSAGTSEIYGGDTRPENQYLRSEFVPKDMDRFFKWLDTELAQCDPTKGDGIVIAALAYQRILSIHPPPDGSGRMGRLVMRYILLTTGLLPSTLEEKNYCTGNFILRDTNPSPDDACRAVMEGLEKTCELLKFKLEDKS